MLKCGHLTWVRRTPALAAASALLLACGETRLDTTALVDGGLEPAARTPYVSGRFLHDRCGGRVLARGIVEMVVWSGGRDGVPEYEEIAKTNANAVRIVWSLATDATADDLDRALTNALGRGLLPHVELHDAQGNFARLPELVAYWTRSDVLAVLLRHEHALLLGIGSGVGAEVPRDEWERGYTDALSRLRAAGIRCPIVIDAPRFGQDIDRLQESGSAVIAADPLHNVLLSVDVWWTDQIGPSVDAELREAVALDLPLVIGEFSGYAAHECPRYVLDHSALLRTAAELELGYFAWSWGGVKNDRCGEALNMTSDGTFGTLRDWGLSVAVTDPNSIQKTSRPIGALAAGAACP